MKYEKSLLTGQGVTYGRIAPHIHSKKVKRLTNAVFIVHFYLPDGVPSYAHGKHMFYRVGEMDYKIYNPQQFTFNLETIIAFLSTWHRQVDGDLAEEFQIVDED